MSRVCWCIVVLVVALSSAGCMSAWEPRRYLDDYGKACGPWDVDCGPAAYGIYGCGPSGCGTPVPARARDIR